MKICGDVDARELQQGMKIYFEFSSYCQKKLDCDHITAFNSRRKKIKKTPFEEAVEINNNQNIVNEHIDISQNNILESSANQNGKENEHE